MNEGDPTIEGSLLPDCTVRIEVGQTHKGTGFFAAPGLVVTCSHVVRSKQLASPDTATEVAVVDPGGVRHPVALGAVTEWPEEDIAILRVRDDHRRLSVLLESSTVRTRDKLHTFGYPTKHKEGVPTVIDAEGESLGESPKVKLSGGVIEPGMSGSPVFNLRTGGVCAILKSTRDKTQAVGGYGIPIRTLFRLAPMIQRANEQQHEKDDRWTSLLGPRQQLLLRAATRRRTGEPEARQFVVSVGQSKDGWQVSANVYTEGVDETIDPVPVDLNTVRREVARLFRDWASRGRVHEPDQIQLLGGILYSALFPDAIGVRFEDLLPRRAEEPLHVALTFAQGADRDLIQLPWEHLYVPRKRGDVHVAVDGSLGFARTLVRDPEAWERPPGPPLSILLVGVLPAVGGGAPAKLVENIVADIQAAAARIRGIDLTVVRNPDPEVLKDDYWSPDYDVIHYVGFGRFEKGADELALGSDTESGIDYFPIEAFAEALRGAPPKLAVLQIAEGPSGDVPADFAVLAPSLLDELVDAVVAHQAPLGREAYQKFNHTLYDTLAAGASVTNAVQQGREKLRNLVGARASVSPALFLRAPGELRLVSPVSSKSRPLSSASAVRQHG